MLHNKQGGEAGGQRQMPKMGLEPQQSSRSTQPILNMTVWVTMSWNCWQLRTEDGGRRPHLLGLHSTTQEGSAWQPASGVAEGIDKHMHKMGVGGEKRKRTCKSEQESYIPNYSLCLPFIRHYSLLPTTGHWDKCWGHRMEGGGLCSPEAHSLVSETQNWANDPSMGMCCKIGKVGRCRCTTIRQEWRQGRGKLEKRNSIPGL